MSRDAFSYYYIKRKILPNGYCTDPLDIVGSPFSDINHHIISENESDILSLSSPLQFQFPSIPNVQFNSILQAILYKMAEFHQNHQLQQILQQSNKINEVILKMVGCMSVDHSWYPKLEKLLDKLLTLKMSAQPEFQNQLLETGRAHIVYCNKYLKFVSCGLSEKIVEITETDKIIDQNYYGEKLMSLRKQLRK